MPTGTREEKEIARIVLERYVVFSTQTTRSMCTIITKQQPERTTKQPLDSYTGMRMTVQRNFGGDQSSLLPRIGGSCNRGAKLTQPRHEHILARFLLLMTRENLAQVEVVTCSIRHGTHVQPGVHPPLFPPRLRISLVGAVATKEVPARRRANKADCYCCKRAAGTPIKPPNPARFADLHPRMERGQTNWNERSRICRER